MTHTTTVDIGHAHDVMDRCRTGTRTVLGGNGLHAECYGTIDALMHERDELLQWLSEREPTALVPVRDVLERLGKPPA